MKRFASILLGLVLSSLALTAQTSAQQYVNSQISQEPLKGSTWGIYAKDASGKVLASHNADTRLMPASNRKLITTGVALHALGPDFRFRTGLGYTGEIKADGTLDGDLYIMGGGDPTIGTQDTTIALKADALFWKWKTLLREKGIQRIHGRIIGDGSSMEGLLEHPSWEYDDMGTYYGTGGNALCFYENTIDMQVAATQEGQLISLNQIYPETPWLHVTNFGVTGPAGSGNSLYLYTTDLAPYAQMNGVFGIDRQPKIESTSNKFGALTCAYYFWKNLQATGWEVTGGYAHVNRAGKIQGPDFTEAEKAAKPKEIGFTESPRLADIARITNERSDNFYAESMLRYMGERATGVAEYDSCLVAESVVLRDLGLNLDQINLADGSGLSAKNWVTPEWMVSYLEAIQKSPAFDSFLASLPKPGEGTLSSIRFPGSERVRMKSGSLSGTLCYSGYILDENGKPAITFSILTNSSLATTSQVRSVLMRMVRKLME
ncbi:MAG: D-alanyl-D-alanine carboxypeptidase/D-alanyl-D-alanine-endopeptidase [Bacteroidales bacterium]|nr:D-alanyl-D-alanine carboxypeptidase/D-alanyl-D-alanine-endopeptidase [Bacteroidales bacterium]